MENFNIKEIIAKYTKSKKALTFVLIFIIGIFLLLIPAKLNDVSTKDAVPTEKDDIRTNEEERLEKILTSVDGIERVKVMICFLDGGVKEYYNDESEDINQEKIKTDKKIVITRKDGEEMPVLKREITPEVRGVSIVADCKKRGMEDIIYTLTSKALGVEIHKIQVVINDRS